MKTEKWKTVRLGDVCEKGSSNIAQNEITDNNGEYPIYGAAGFIKNVDFYKQDKPYIGIVKDGAGVGRVSVHPAKSSLIGTMQYIFPKENIDIKFLAEFLKYQNLSRFYTGATIPHIYFKDYQKIPLKLPSLQKQKHISAVLDKCTALIAKHKLMLEKYDTLVKSRFIEMFGDPRINSKNLPSVKFIDVIKLQRGFDLPVQERDSTGTINVYGSNGVLGKHNEIKVKGPGIVTGRSGTLGKVYYVLEDYWPLNTTLFSVDTHGNNVIYLKYLLEAFELERFTEGAGVPTLNRNIVHEKEIINAPLELQQQFAAFVQQIDKSKFEIWRYLKFSDIMNKIGFRFYD